MKTPTLDAPTAPLLDGDRAAMLPDANDESPIDGQRPMGINIGGHTVTQATEHLPEAQKQLVRWLHHHARHNHLGWRDLSSQVKLDSSTISRIWKDQYRNSQTGERVPLESVCEKIARYKLDQERGGKARNPEFVRTSVAGEIYWLCDRALRNHRMAFLFGDGQVGKTFGLTQFAAEHNGGQTSYFDCPPGGVQYMLKRFARALLVPDNQPYDRMIEDIISALDPSKLVLIDNVHRIFEVYQKTSIARCLSTLQYIYDRAGCGMVISATTTFRDQVRSGEFRNALKQLNRRGRSYELLLPPAPPREDLDMISAWFGLEPAPDKEVIGDRRNEKTGQMERGPIGNPAHIISHIASHDGIGVFRLRLCDGQDYAAKKKQSLRWEHFVAAYNITEKAAAGIRLK